MFVVLYSELSEISKHFDPYLLPFTLLRKIIIVATQDYDLVDLGSLWNCVIDCFIDYVTSDKISLEIQMLMKFDVERSNQKINS